jgi:hypothetical protein
VGRGAPDPSMACRLSPRNTTVLNSKVISVTVKPPPRSLLTPLEIEFAHMYSVSTLRVHVRVHGPLHLSPCAHTSRPLAGLERELLYPRAVGGDSGWQSFRDLPRVTGRD